MNIYPDIPADNDSSDVNNWFKNGYDVLNNFRLAVRQFMEVDHCWGAADDGVHTRLTLHAQDADPPDGVAMSIFSRISAGSGYPEVCVKTPFSLFDVTMQGRVHYPCCILTNQQPLHKDALPLTYSAVPLDGIIYCHSAFFVGGVRDAGHYLFTVRGPVIPNLLVAGGQYSKFTMLGASTVREVMASAWLPAGDRYGILTDEAYDAPASSIIMAVMRIA